MIVIAALVIGILLGIANAKRRGGRGKDMLQYAVAFGILFAILGLFITIIVHRAAV